MTVSRVVRGGSSVHLKTKAIVEKAVRELGYRPDPVLSALAAYRTAGREQGDGGTIVFLDCDGSDYSRKVYAGAEAESLHLGYQLEGEKLPREKKERARLARVLYHRGVRGLLLGPSELETDLGDWPWANFAAISIGALEHRPALHAVAPDYFQGAYGAVQLLRERGCRRIGFAVSSDLEKRTGHRWIGGYMAAVGSRGSIVFLGKGVNRSSFSRWCVRERVDGVLTIHRNLYGGWKGRRDRFLILNETSGAAASEEDCLSYLSLNPSTLGSEGVRMLHHQLLRREYGVPELPRRNFLQGKWREPAGAVER